MLGFRLDVLWNETCLPQTYLKNKLEKIIHPSNLAESGKVSLNIFGFAPVVTLPFSKRPRSFPQPFPPPSGSQQCRHPTKGWALVEGTSDHFVCWKKKTILQKSWSSSSIKWRTGMWSWNCTSFPASNPAQQVCPLLVGFLFARKHFHELLRLEPGFIVGGGIGNFFSNFLDFLVILQMKYSPRKLTRQWKIPMFNGKYNLKCLVFHCHVSEYLFWPQMNLFGACCSAKRKHYLLPLPCCLLMCIYTCTKAHAAVTLYNISVTN